MKKVLSGLLGIIFVVFVVVAVFVCTYVFSTPSKDMDSQSRQLIKGYWTCEDKNIKLEFDPEGAFTMTHADDDSMIAKGYFKIDEDDSKIKLLVLPKDRDESVDLGLKLGFFATITYKDLEYPPEDKTAVAFRSSKKKDIKEATCKFLISNTSNVYSCERTTTITDFYDGTTGKTDSSSSK